MPLAVTPIFVCKCRESMVQAAVRVVLDAACCPRRGAAVAVLQRKLLRSAMWLR
jgi:hypothetical protein